MSEQVKQLLQENIDQCLRTPLSVSTLRRLYLNEIRHLFSTTQNYYDDDGNMQCLTWNPDQKGGVNYLDITLSENFDPKSLNPCPSVVVVSQNMGLKKIAENDYAGSSPDKSTAYYTREASLPFVFINTARTSSQAISMGDMVLDHLMGTRPIILGKFDQSMLGIEVMGMQKPIKQGNSNADWQYAVIVDMLIVFNYGVAVQTEGRRLRGSSVDLLADHITGLL